MPIHELDLRGASKNARTLIAFAVHTGWSVTRTKGGGYLFEARSESGNQTFSIPPAAGNQHANQQWMDKLARYAPNRDAVARAQLGAAGLTSPDEFMRNPEVRAAYTGVADADRIEVKAPPEPVRVVSSAPYQSKRGTSDKRGLYYDSPAIIQRTWSDGSTDFKCARCGYTAPAAPQVGGHQRKHLKSEARPEVFAGPAYEPSGAAQRLANRIAEAMEALGPGASPMQLAERMLERGQTGESEAEHRGPLTDEQVIERIRSLVDRGSYLEARERAERLAQDMAALTSELESAKAAQLAAESKWSALRELIQEDS